MKWKTTISTEKGGEHMVRDHALSKLMEKHSFTEVTFLLLAKRLPTVSEARLFDMMLVACAEHGIAAPSSFSARVSASVGNPLNASVAAGLLAMGEFHGGAIEAAAKNFSSEKSAEALVGEHLAQKKRLAGYGHKIYKDVDPRAERLLRAARELDVAGVYTQKAQLVQKELVRQSGKTLPLNIDGALAALLCDMGFSWRVANACFIIGRLPGIVAHIEEESENEKPYRRLDESDIEYTG